VSNNPLKSSVIVNRRCRSAPVNSHRAAFILDTQFDRSRLLNTFPPHAWSAIRRSPSCLPLTSR